MPRFEDLAAEGQALVELGGEVVGVDVATQAALTDHAADTTDVHGIADTALLETTAGAQAKADAAEAAANTYTDNATSDLSPWPRFNFVPGVSTANNLLGSHTFPQSSGGFFGSSRNMLNIGDYAEWNLPFLAGSWSLDLEAILASSGGTAQVAVNGVSVLTFDTYNGAGGTGRFTATGITIAESGVYPVRVTVTGKHASSSNPYVRLSGFAVALPGTL